MERQPPIRNEAIAAMNAQRKRSRACPSGCAWSGGLLARCSPIARKSSLTQSAPECAASAIKPPERDTSPAASLAAAMATLASSATTIVRTLSPSRARRSAVADRGGEKRGDMIPRALEVLLLHGLHDARRRGGRDRAR